ncbi:hypothetical protein ACFL34_05565 [Candidatus Sumerlaeota bacterium]
MMKYRMANMRMCRMCVAVLLTALLYLACERGQEEAQHLRNRRNRAELANTVRAGDIAVDDEFITQFLDSPSSDEWEVRLCRTDKYRLYILASESSSGTLRSHSFMLDEDDQCLLSTKGFFMWSLLPTSGKELKLLTLGKDVQAAVIGQLDTNWDSDAVGAPDWLLFQIFADRGSGAFEKVFEARFESFYIIEGLAAGGPSGYVIVFRDWRDKSTLSLTWDEAKKVFRVEGHISADRFVIHQNGFQPDVNSVSGAEPKE